MTEPALDPRFHAAADAMLARVRAARRILVPTHVHADGDSLAAVLALGRALRGLGKEVVAVVSDGHVPHLLEFLADDSLVFYSGQPLPPTDLAFLADTTGPSRLGPLYDGVRDRLTPAAMLNLDHHVSNERFADVNLVDPAAAATAELIALLLRRWGVPLTPALATPLLAGIMTDTLGFQTSSTSPRTMYVAGDLLAAGAPLEPLVAALFRAKPLTTARLFAAVVGSARLEGRLLCADVTERMLAETGARPSEAEGAVNYLAGVEEAVVFALFYERPDGWRVSLRSRSDAVDVSALAARFGGGGHPRAAGCTLVGGPAVREQFVAAVQAAIEARGAEEQGSGGAGA